MTITPFAGAGFWFTTTAFILLHTLLQKGKAALWVRNSFMIGVSLTVLSLTLNNSFTLLSLLSILTCIVFCTGKSLAQDKGKKTLNLIAIVLVIFFLCYFKYSIFQSFINNLFHSLTPFFAPRHYTFEHHIFFMGVSYFSFKFIHFIVECRKGKINDLNFLTFINYTLFFPSFFSGPINRYNSFAQSISKETHVTDNYLIGVKRIINGLFKKIVLGDFLFAYSIVAVDLTTATSFDIIIGIYAYMFYIYFNFSGYTDMAIGCGKMVGIELPENFNYPFFRRNLQQFWANWHISLTLWLTDYIYWPLAKKLRRIKKLRKKAVTISNISIVITFLICGIWHGDGLNFIIWGLYNGVGLAILNGYSHVIKKYTSRNIKKFIHKSPVAYGVSNFITFQYVGFGFLIFTCDMERLQAIATIFFQLA